MQVTFRARLRKAAPFLLFGIFYLAALAYQFFPLVSTNELLPGNDTLGHFWALTDFIRNLSAGHFFQYTTSWLGGMPIFQFYAPFSFLVMAGASFAFGKWISLFLIYRWFIFLTLAVFPVSFYFFTREFLGKKAAYAALWFSPFLLFLPKAQGALGFGAAGAIQVGLFDQMLAASFLLWYLVMVKRLAEEDRWRFRTIVCGAVALALVFLTHTLTSIMAGFLTLVVALYYARRWFSRGYLPRLASTVGLGISLAAFWLLPFAARLPFTSAERVDVGPWIPSVLNLFLNFDLTDFLRGDARFFYYALFFTALLFFVGLWKLHRERNTLMLWIFGAVFFAFGLEYFNTVLFPTLPLHYYRLFAFDIIFFLAIASYGFITSFAWLSARKKIFGYALVALFGLALAHHIFLFSLSGGAFQFNNKPRLTGVQDRPYHFRIADYPWFRAANDTLKFLRSPGLSAPPERVLADMNPPEMIDNLGSIHFFNMALPFVNREASLLGLYVESSWQLPFLFPTTNAVTGNNMFWGRVRDLAYSSYFRTQGLDDMIRRLQLFGTNYFITASEYFDKQAQKVKDAKLLTTIGSFKVYYLRGAKPLVYSAPRAPGLFIQDGGADFRQFSLGWYSNPALLDFPVAAWDQGLAALTPARLAPFQFLVVSTPRTIDSRMIEALARLGKPVLVVHDGPPTMGSIADTPARVEEIADFRPVAGYYNSPIFEDANGEAIRKMGEFILQNAGPEASSSAPLAMREFGDFRIRFRGTGPTIINLGYFPYWQCTEGCDRVYPLTPGQMLVFANGSTKLEYLPGADAVAGKWISIVAAGGILLFAFARAIRTRKRFSTTVRGSTSDTSHGENLG